MIVELVGPRSESTIIIMLNGHSITRLSKFTPLYLVQLSDIIREVSSCSAWWLTQKLSTGQSAENNC